MITTVDRSPLRRERRAGELVELSAVPRRMVLVWAALFLNVLTFYAVPIVVPVPAAVGQLMTQGALPLALGLALIVAATGLVLAGVYRLNQTAVQRTLEPRRQELQALLASLEDPAPDTSESSR